MWRSSGSSPPSIQLRPAKAPSDSDGNRSARAARASAASSRARARAACRSGRAATARSIRSSTSGAAATTGTAASSDVDLQRRVGGIAHRQQQRAARGAHLPVRGLHLEPHLRQRRARLQDVGDGRQAELVPRLGRREAALGVGERGAVRLEDRRRAGVGEERHLHGEDAVVDGRAVRPVRRRQRPASPPRRRRRARRSRRAGTTAARPRRRWSTSRPSASSARVAEASPSTVGHQAPRAEPYRAAAACASCQAARVSGLLRRARSIASGRLRRAGRGSAATRPSAAGGPCCCGGVQGVCGAVAGGATAHPAARGEHPRQACGDQRDGPNLQAQTPTVLRTGDGPARQHVPGPRRVKRAPPSLLRRATP